MVVQVAQYLCIKTVYKHAKVVKHPIFWAAIRLAVNNQQLISRAI